MDRRLVLGLGATVLAAAGATFLLVSRPGPAALPPTGRGCGVPARGTGKLESRSLRVGSLDRTYSLFVPAHYESARPYPVIFRFHGHGGDGQSGGLGIEQISRDDAIVVGLDGQRARDGQRSWDEPHEQDDVAFFDALLAALEARYCIDRERVYAYGFSAGGAFSERLACRRGDVLRAIGAIAAYPLTQPKPSTCRGQTAALIFHDHDDPAVPIAAGRASRDVIRSLNGCSDQTVPDGESCVRFQDCSPGQPVVWCESHTLGHDIRGDVAPAKVWAFFKSL